MHQTSASMLAFILQMVPQKVFCHLYMVPAPVYLHYLYEAKIIVLFVRWNACERRHFSGLFDKPNISLC